MRDAMSGAGPRQAGPFDRVAPDDTGLRLMKEVFTQRKPAVPTATAVPPLTAQELAIARSVLYAALFDYPLTLAQLRQTLIESALTPTEILTTCAQSAALRETVEQRDDFFYPAGRHDLVAERRRREALSLTFLRRHRTFLMLVCALPRVRMVALSGSVAHLNLEGSGDLDLFIVTRGCRVWSVAVAVVLVAKLLGVRRTVCANFVLSDERLALEQQDLFTASQIIHLKPLVGMDAFRRFVEANPFVARFYPNFHPALARHGPMRVPVLPNAARRVLDWLLALPSAAAEPICRLAYRRYLQRRSHTWRSPEQVRLDRDCVKLHTQSHRQAVLERFEHAVHTALTHAS
jgi:hypothetical protein